MNGPLSAADIPAVNRGLTTLSDIQTIIAKCKNCGIDLAEAQAMIDQQRELLLALKREFMMPQNQGMNPDVPR